MQTKQRPIAPIEPADQVLPAKLPEHSRAAAAQRLDERPLKPAVGVYYPVPHRKLHPEGWHTKLYIKRKNLRRSKMQYAAVDRVGTQWTMLPMAMGTMAVLVVLVSLLVALVGIAQATQQRFDQQVLTLQDILPKDSLKMYDSKGILIYQMTDQGLQTTVPLSKISPNLINAEIAIEDQNFWKDPGFDITGIVRAALQDVTQKGYISGGSTITQQLIKNNVVGNRDTIIRKLEELILAPEVTRRFTKQQILAMYLNTVYYGEQAYGANAAAFSYFNLKDTPTKTAASQLDLAQAAMLAGIPSNPSLRDPYLHPKGALQRMIDVLTQMRLQGYITAQQEQLAIFEAEQPGFLHHGVIHNDPIAKHFANYAVNELTTVLHVKRTDLARAGLIVSTTLDLKLQKSILKIAQKHIAELKIAHHMSNAAVVMIDFHNGAVRVLLGNIDPSNLKDGDFDVATQGYRQSGSSFKPFIYATAFAHGISPGMPVYDTPITIQLCCGLPAYTPSNYDLKFHGLISFRYALQNSFNVPAVKLLTRVGVDNALHTAQIMGITDYKGTPNYTMVLGTLGIHLIDETSAYGVFANGGVRIPPHAIDTIRDTEGRLVYQFVPQGKRVISKQVAYLMSNVLSDNKSRLYEFYDCNMLQLFSNTRQQCWAGDRGVVRPAAAKTGTSSDFRDNWTVGYTTEYVMGVWAGNNDNSPMVNVTGVDGAAPIWHDSMLLVEQGRPMADFQDPGGLVLRTITYPEGITTTDWYLK